MNLKLRFFALLFIAFLFPKCLFASPTLLHLDWKNYLAKYDLLWNRLPEKLWQSPFMGNGMLGTYIVYEEDCNSMRFEVCRSDVHDHRAVPETGDGNILFNRSRLMIGHFLMKPCGRILKCDMRTDIYNAETSGTIITDKGSIRFEVFVHSLDMGIIVKTDASSGENGFTWQWVSDSPNSPRYDKFKASGNTSKVVREYKENASAVVDEENRTALFTYLNGGQTAVRWHISGKGSARSLYVTCAHSYPDHNALQLSREYLDRILKPSYSKLKKTHREWWNNFYQKSFVSLPDKRIENFYWIQLYKLGSATRADRGIIDNTGPWMALTQWPAAWWNLNVQLSYWTTYPSNHLELSRSLSNTIFAGEKNLILNVPKKYRYNSAALARATAPDLVGWVREAGASKDGPEIGLLTWACHNIWLEYRYSMDKEILKKLFPILKRSVNYYLHFLKEEDDKRFHLPSTYSPEYGSASDCNFDLSLLKWGCKTLLEADSILGKNDSLRSRWKDVYARLADFPSDPDEGWMIGRDRPYDMSHRHYSHLLMAYPLYLVNRDQPGGKEMIVKSVNHWQSIKGALEGYSRTGAASLYASVGEGDKALAYLEEFMQKSMQPNTCYQEGGNPVIETPLSAARALLDMALQSWGGKIRIFPAIPGIWRDFAFDNLLAEGAFEVSAVRKNGKVAWIRIHSLAGEPCLVECDFSGELYQKGKRRYKIDRISDTLFSLDLKAGEEVVLYGDPSFKDFRIGPVSGTENKKPFGFYN